MKTKFYFFKALQVLCVYSLNAKRPTDTRACKQLSTNLKRLKFPKRVYEIPKSLPARASWNSSRQCLFDAVCDWRFKGYTSEELLFSLSHSSELSVAAVALKSTNLAKSRLGLGVDSEPLARVISSAIIKRITHKKQKYVFRNRTLAWCSSEAAFKSDPENKNGVLSQTLFLSSKKAQRRNLQIRLASKILGNSQVTIALSYKSQSPY